MGQRRPERGIRPEHRDTTHHDSDTLRAPWSADGRRIPWTEVSHFDDETMRALMRQVVDRLYTFQMRAEEPGFLERIARWMDVASRWAEPKLDESFLPQSAGRVNS